MKKMLNEGNQIHNFISSSGSGTEINYGSCSDFLTSYGSGSTGQKVTVPTVPVPQRCLDVNNTRHAGQALVVQASIPLPYEAEVSVHIGPGIAFSLEKRGWIYQFIIYMIIILFHFLRSIFFCLFQHLEVFFHASENFLSFKFLDSMFLCKSGLNNRK
jgi:hypothetical protein